MEVTTSSWLLPYHVSEVLDSPQEIQDWHLSKTHVPDLWVKAAGEGIRVGVADTGTSLTHPDLIHAYNEVRNFTRSGSDDVQGHGTHCSGIIAARANGLGVVGVAPACRLYHAKVLGDDGSGSDTDIANGIEWLAAEGCRVISLSLGSSSASPRINDAINEATRNGIAIVCAAGNSGPGPQTQEWPSRNPNAIAVAAVDATGTVASFSSRGPHIAIAAPGVDILSTFKGKTYARLSGTSMATPFVAGCLALAMSAGDTRSPQAILKDAALLRADNQAYGWGLISPVDLLKAPTNPPTNGPRQIVFDNGIKISVPASINFTT